jgi:hypothetical protein
MAAQTKPVSSRAMATTTLGRGFPLSNAVEASVEAMHGPVRDGDDACRLTR